jgi:DNA-binding response OmpR family regulator
MDRRRLLLVDDDPQMATLVRILARRAGLTLAWSADVDAAWTAIQAELPDLVLLDINLPGRSGLELLRLRRDLPAGGSFPVAIFCQTSLPRDVAAGWQAGADYLLAKNLVTQPAAWQERVDEILAHAHGQAPPRSLGWLSGGNSALLSNWGRVLNRALDHTALRPLAAEVIDQVLRRALACSFGPAIGISGSSRSPAAFDVERLSPAPSVVAVRDCFASLLDQVWRLLGTDACALFEADLRKLLAEPAAFGEG